MTATGNVAVRRGILARSVLPLVSARTWLAVIHLLAGFVTGLVAFLVIGTGIPVGVGLLPLFLVGIVILAAVCWLSGQFARAERARFHLMLGQRIPSPAPRP